MRTAATIVLRTVPRAALALPPAWRRRVLIMLAALAALGGLYMLWFRDSSFVRVEKVQISGLSGPQSKAIRDALVGAGMGMTTLHVRNTDLRDAVATYPVVRSVTAQGKFPHILRIQVELNLPVAALQTASGRIPVTSDGLLLRDVPLSGGLPLLRAPGSLPDTQVSAGRAFALLRVVATAPPALRDRIRGVELKAALGLVAHLRRGPDLIFGDAGRMAAKWVAASRVLASPAARGATYIDLRLPERPAAGGLSTTGVLPLAPAGTSAEALQAPPVTPAATGTTTTPAPTTTQAAPAPTQAAPTTTQPAPATTQPAPATTAPASTTSPSAATPGGGQQAPQQP